MCFSTYFKVQQIYFSIVCYSEENRNKTCDKLHLEEEKLWNRIVYIDAYQNKARIAERY